MKFIGTLIISLLLSCNFALAQDTLYIYRAGIVVSKRAVSEIDSINFYKNYKNADLPTVLDIDGNAYHTVRIGNQTWMVENLKTTKYRNGESINYLIDKNIWIGFTTGAWCYYNNKVENGIDYGKLYNWFAVTDSRNIAPAGWHVATNDEWTTMRNYLISSGYNYDGTTTGNKVAKYLSAKTNWVNDTSLGAVGNDFSKNNASGFTAYPAGYRGSLDGNYYEGGYNCSWWSPSANSLGLIMTISNSTSGLYNGDMSKQAGLPVRCIKNLETVPEIITTTISAVTKTSALCGGNITSNGGATITASGLCWSTKVNPTIVNAKTISGVSTGVFTSSLKGLFADSTYYVRAYATNSVGTAYGNQISFKTLKDSTLTITDIDGNIYNTITIGTQTWMVENLKTTKYRNGELIGTTIPATKDISYESSPKYQWAFNGLESNATKYGRLYTWFAATDIRNIAPTGWHVPNDAEWSIFENYLIANGYNYDGSTIGNSETNNKIAKSLAAKSDWTLNTSEGAIGNDLSKNNSTGFNALPGGNRINNGSFGLQKLGGYWWSSTEYDYGWSWYRDMGYNVKYMGRHNYTSKQNGFSIRCIKDSIPKITLPTVTTKSISAITKTSATCGGSIISNGGTKITAKGICWSTSTLPTIASNKTTITTDSVTFTSSIIGLSPDSTYYVRAFATNNVGTAYGNQLILNTLKDSTLTITDIDGNVYNTIKIGKQTWMKENLKTTRYNDSTLIPMVTDGYQWINTTSGAYSWVKNDVFNKGIYGGIYNFYAAASGKLAPKGWHVPSQAEIDSLVTYLGGYTAAIVKLKEAGNLHWNTANDESTNSSGFTALPGGYRSSATGDYHNSGEWGVFWSSSESNGMGGRLILRSSSESSDYIFSSKLFGFNVRCIKD